VADFLSRYHGMNIHVMEVKYDKGRINAAVALLSHKDLGAPVQMVDASPFRIRVLQNTDTQLKSIKDDPAIPSSTHKNLAVGKSVHCKIPATVIDDILYVRASLRKGHVIRNNLRIAVPTAMSKEILTEAHNSWIGGHGGRFKTTERLRGEFWWPGMDADIDKHVATCVTCQAATNKDKTNPPPWVPLPEPRGPNRRVHCDLWGPVRSSTKKNSYVMVVTDAFTKFATAVAIPGKEAMHVAPALLSHFYTLGIPQQLVTDQGREYCNELEKHLWTTLKISHDTTTPYHPACNSAVETFNKILKHYIATALVDAEALKLDWEAYLAPLLFAYNTAVSSSTKVTPFEATFGYDPRVPLWEGVKYPGDEIVERKDFAEYLAEVKHTQLRTREIAHHNNQQCRQEYKDKYDAANKVVYPRYVAGDRVWVRVMDKNQRSSNPKLAATWKRGTIVKRGVTGTSYKVDRQDRKHKKVKRSMSNN
jgi:transposase InsO family protein